MSYVIEHQATDGITFYGGASETWGYKGHEYILSGPYETGKTLANLYKLNALLWLYPRSRAVITRNTYASLLSTAVVTYEEKVLGFNLDAPNSPIKKYGGTRPTHYEYGNGSHLLLVGLDKPQKLLSGEFDFILFVQLEETPLNAYELALGRCTGRAGNAPYPQVMSDCNPGHPEHWILKREQLKMFEQLHIHNPALFDQRKKQWTVQGERTRQILSGLTGLRHKRGYLGQWAGAEGAVYEDYRRERHVIDPFDIPKSWRRIRVVDFGYTNPFVCQWWAIDPDGRLYLYREIYMSQRLVSDHAQQIKTLSQGERIDYTVTDHDPENAATLNRHGIPTGNVDKTVSIESGIELVQLRLRDVGDGKPRIFFMEGATVEIDRVLVEANRPTSTIQEIASYSYPEGVDGKPNKEQPIKDNDHGMDAMRYAIVTLDRARKKFFI